MLDTANALVDLALHERQRWQLSPDLRLPFFEAMEAWRRDDNTRRLWERDASLWTGHDEAKWLGWLTVAEDQLADLDGLLRAVEDIEEAGFKDILLLGMGGSCLFPEVLSLTFGRVPLYPQLLVLDSTDPEQIQRFASQLDLRKTLFVVSSKSGETLETSILKDFFYDETRKTVGVARAGSHFIAITDPGSKLQQTSEAQHFRHVFAGVESISGRFSALSNFGMVPAAAMGLDLGTLLVRTLKMVHACGADIPVELNPGVPLGLILGVAGNHGRDKVTLVVSPAISALGEWIEQLLAESTGKAGKGLIPIAEEELGDVSDYPEDRLFCYIRDKGVADPMQDARIDALEKAGHPVVRIDFRDKYDLGQEIFRWEIAVATAGSVMSINPFNQPDVEASKAATRQLMAEYSTKGSLPAEPPLAQDEELVLYTDERNAAELTRPAHGKKSVTALLETHLQRFRPGDYFALLAFMDMNDENKAVLETIRHEVQNRYSVATSLGFGPRYLHSIGQVFKGGPNTGVFLQITRNPANDLLVPGQKYTFGVVEAAQARGDLSVLTERGRRALRVHLTGDAQQGLNLLREQVMNALRPKTEGFNRGNEGNGGKGDETNK